MRLDFFHGKFDFQDKILDLKGIAILLMTRNN